MKVINIEKNLLFQFINNITKFVWWKDKDSIFIGCNEKLAYYIGLNSADEIIGKSDYDIFDTKEDAESVIKIDQEIMASGKPQLNFEEYLTMGNLGKRWLSTSKIPLYGDEGEIIGTIGWFKDITEFKELEFQINEKNKALFEYNIELKIANQHLELVNSDLEKFTYAASHDLKGPVRTTKCFAELLKKNEGINLDKKALEYVDIICEATNRMKNLIEDILAYAQAGSSELIAESTDINEIISDKMIDLQPSYGEHSVDINLNLPKEKIKVYPQLIGLVFYNLLSNGIKFNDSPMPKIDCSYTEDDNFWTFSIQDNGIGIDQKYAEDIFKPFKRLVHQGIEGSGIGLSICNRIVTLHKGKIWLEQSMIGSTTFKFTISKHLK